MPDPIMPMPAPDSPSSLHDFLESFARSSYVGLVQLTRGNGLAHFDLHYPFMAAEGVLERLTHWRQEQEDALGRLSPGDDISHEGTLAAYTDSVCTQSMVAIVVPLLESVLIEFSGTKLRVHHERGALRIKTQTDRGKAPMGNNFWSIGKRYEGQSWKDCGKILGFTQLCEALELPNVVPSQDISILEALFWYRNRALHHGLHWQSEDLEVLKSRIEGAWSGIFSGTFVHETSGTQPVVVRLRLPAFTRDFERDLLPWLRRFLTSLGDLDIALKLT